MDLVLGPLCCIALVLPMASGLGVSFYAERFLGRRAYLVGWFVPVFIFAALYGLYHLWLRLLSCTPVNRLICGEPFLNLFLLFIAVVGAVMLANGLAQFALYLFIHRHDAPPVSEMEENVEGAEASPEQEAAPFSEPEQTLESNPATAAPLEGDVLTRSDEPTPE